VQRSVTSLTTLFFYTIQNTPPPVPTGEPPSTSSRSRRNKASPLSPSPVHSSDRSSIQFNQPPSLHIQCCFTSVRDQLGCESLATNARRSLREIGPLGFEGFSKVRRRSYFEGTSSAKIMKNCQGKWKGKGSLLDPIGSIFDIRYGTKRNGARLSWTLEIANVKLQNSDFYVQLITE